MSQYKTISVTEELWLLGGKTLNTHIEAVTRRLGADGWHVLGIKRDKANKNADVQFIRP